MPPRMNGNNPRRGISGLFSFGRIAVYKISIALGVRKPAYYWCLLMFSKHQLTYPNPKQIRAAVFVRRPVNFITWHIDIAGKKHNKVSQITDLANCFIIRLTVVLKSCRNRRWFFTKAGTKVAIEWSRNAFLRAMPSFTPLYWKHEWFGW